MTSIANQINQGKESYIVNKFFFFDNEKIEIIVVYLLGVFNRADEQFEGIQMRIGMNFSRAVCSRFFFKSSFSVCFKFK